MLFSNPTEYKGFLFSTCSPAFVSSVQSLSHVRLFVTPCTAVNQAYLFITNSQSLLKLMSIELVMPSNHLILRHPLLLLPSTFPSIRVFPSESVCHNYTIISILIFYYFPSSFSNLFLAHFQIFYCLLHSL